MNTLAHIAAMVAVGWLAEFLIVDRSEAVLGFVAIVVGALFIPMTWVALEEDKEIMGGKWWPF